MALTRALENRGPEEFTLRTASGGENNPKVKKKKAVRHLQDSHIVKNGTERFSSCVDPTTNSALGRTNPRAPLAASFTKTPFAAETARGIGVTHHLFGASCSWHALCRRLGPHQRHRGAVLRALLGCHSGGPILLAETTRSTTRQPFTTTCSWHVLVRLAAVSGEAAAPSRRGLE